MIRHIRGHSSAHIFQIRIVLFHKFTILHAPITKIAEQKKKNHLIKAIEQFHFGITICVQL